MSYTRYTCWFWWRRAALCCPCNTTAGARRFSQAVFRIARKYTERKSSTKTAGHTGPIVVQFWPEGLIPAEGVHGGFMCTSYRKISREAAAPRRRGEGRRLNWTGGSPTTE